MSSSGPQSVSWLWAIQTSSSRSCSEGVGNHRQGHLCLCSDFLFLLLKKQQHLGGGREREVDTGGEGQVGCRVERRYQLGPRHLRPPTLPGVLLGVIRHLYLCRRCDGGVGVTGSGIVSIQLPIGGIQCLGEWVAEESRGL